MWCAYWFEDIRCQYCPPIRIDWGAFRHLIGSCSACGACCAQISEATSTSSNIGECLKWLTKWISWSLRKNLYSSSITKDLGIKPTHCSCTAHRCFVMNRRISHPFSTMSLKPFDVGKAQFITVPVSRSLLLEIFPLLAQAANIPRILSSSPKPLRVCDCYPSQQWLQGRGSRLAEDYLRSVWEAWWRIRAWRIWGRNTAYMFIEHKSKTKKRRPQPRPRKQWDCRNLQQ